MTASVQMIVCENIEFDRDSSAFAAHGIKHVFSVPVFPYVLGFDVLLRAQFDEGDCEVMLEIGPPQGQIVTRIRERLTNKRKPPLAAGCDMALRTRVVVTEEEWIAFRVFHRRQLLVENRIYVLGDGTSRD